MGFIQKMRKKLQRTFPDTKSVEQINQEIKDEMATMMSKQYCTTLYQADLSIMGYKLGLSLGNYLSPANTVQLDVIRLAASWGVSETEIVTAIHELENIKAIVYLEEQETYLCNPHFIYVENGCYSKEHLQLCVWWDHTVAPHS